MKIANEKDLVGLKGAEVLCCDRAETSFSGVQILSISDRGVVFDYESRGSKKVVFLPTHIVDSVHYNAGAVEAPKEEGEAE